MGSTTTFLEIDTYSAFAFLKGSTTHAVETLRRRVFVKWPAYSLNGMPVLLVRDDISSLPRQKRKVYFKYTSFQSSLAYPVSTVGPVEDLVC